MSRPSLANDSDFQHWTLDNGARIYFMAAPQLPMVDIRILFNAGSARDNQQPGLARLTNALLASGTKTLDADTVARQMDDVGANFAWGSARDMAWLSLRSLSKDKYLQPAVDTLAALLTQPAFAEKSLERDRQRMITAARERKQYPGAIASETFFAHLYKNHPYGTPPGGTEDSLKTIQRQQLVDFHSRYYVGNNAVLAIVGDLNRRDAEKLAVKLMGALPAGKPAPLLPQPTPLEKAETIVVEHPSTQTHLLTGQLGMKRGSPDYFALYLANHILGGNGLVSLLTEEIREKRGLVYSVGSRFSPMQQPGPFIISLQTRNTQVGEARQLVNDTLQSFVTKGPDAKQLKDAQQGITGGFPLRIDNNGKIVQYLAMIGFYQLPLDYLKTFSRHIDDQSLETVKKALKTTIHPDRLLTVIVGAKPQQPTH